MKHAHRRRSRRAPSKRRRWSRPIAPLIAVFALTGCTSASHPSQPQPTPLAASAASASGAWAVAHVGAASGEESFWELLWRAPRGTHWKLITPPGVQDNGGLSITTAPEGLIAGFIPSKNLRFSPFASSRDEGRTWTPQVLPAGLFPGPDSLADTANGGTLALLARHDGEVIAQPAAGGQSTPLVSAPMLARTASDCTLQAITAISLTPQGQPILGGPCKQPGATGIYTQEAGRWVTAAPPLPSNLRGDRTRLLRLTRARSSILALIAVHQSRHETLIVAWSDDGGARWSETQPLTLEHGGRLLGTGVGPARQMVVLAESPRGNSLWISEGASSPWRSLPTPPAGTTTVVVRGDRDIEAFQARGRTLVNWQLQVTQQQWHPAAAIHVAL